MAQHEVDLSGKLILVTGATRGIGRAVAVAAAAAGAEIIITGRTIGALEEVDDDDQGCRKYGHHRGTGHEGYGGHPTACLGNCRSVGTA